MDSVKPDDTLRGPFWPEKVRVISVKSIGENQIKIEAVGLETQRFYNPILSLEDVKTVEVIEERPFQFTGDGESLFLYLESHRIRNAFQFDPLYAVNVSQIDPLPTRLKPSTITSCQILVSDSYWRMTLALEKPSCQVYFLRS